MTILNVLAPSETRLGGLSVKRLLPKRNQKMVGPWIFFDHMGPATFAAGTGIDVQPHPHINLATVTYLFQGEILHRDSLGSFQTIQPGAINLMVAGRGIVHSERERDEVRHSAHRTHGLQLWHALPEADEETAPAFYHYPADALPKTNVAGVEVRILMGGAYGVTSPVKTFCETLYGEAQLKTGQKLQPPVASELAVYIVSGSLRIGEETASANHLVLVDTLKAADWIAATDTRIAFIGGEPLPHRYIEWNFVSSRKERIEQAKRDWREQRFPTIPFDDEEFMPLPE